MPRMLEFSDEAFGTRFPAESMRLQIDGRPVVCTMRSTDSRPWMTSYGPVQRGGGSCYDLLQQYPMKQL